MKFSELRDRLHFSWTFPILSPPVQLQHGCFSLAFAQMNLGFGILFAYFKSWRDEERKKMLSSAIALFGAEHSIGMGCRKKAALRT